MNKFLSRYLMLTLGISKTEAEAKAAKIEEEDQDSINEVLDAHSEKIATLKETEKNNGYKLGTKEVKFAFERDLKEKFGIQSDKKGVDLVEELIAAKTSNKEPGEPTEEAIKKSSLYLNLENEFKALPDKIKGEYETKIKEIETKQKRSETMKQVAEKALATLEEAKLDFGAKPDKRKAAITEKLKGNDWLPDGKGDFILLDENGNRKEDDHGNPIKLSVYSKTVAEDLGYDFKIADERSSSGGSAEQGSGGTATGQKYTGKMPETDKEFNELLFSTDLTVDQKTEIEQFYTAKAK